MTEKWASVSKKYPCPICSNTQWCMVSKDGQAVLCHRVQSNRPTATGWVHKLGDDKPVYIPQPSIKNDVPKANPETLNQTYNALLSSLTLYQRHKDNLLQRGLTESQITSLNYKSMPESERYDVIRELARQGIQLGGVPGFWIDDNNNPRLAGQSGICIPVRDTKKRISGIQIRCDDTTGGKYKWLSSAKYRHGCGSGTSIHVSIPPGANNKEVWITEGPLKADIASLKMNCIFIAVPGVACWRDTIPILRKLKSSRIIIAFDMDKTTKPEVNLLKKQLMETLIKYKFRVFEADWDINFKGIDDLLNQKD